MRPRPEIDEEIVPGPEERVGASLAHPGVVAKDAVTHLAEGAPVLGLVAEADSEFERAVDPLGTLEGVVIRWPPAADVAEGTAQPESLGGDIILRGTEGKQARHTQIVEPHPRIRPDIVFVRAEIARRDADAATKHEFCRGPLLRSRNIRPEDQGKTGRAESAESDLCPG